MLRRIVFSLGLTALVAGLCAWPLTFLGVHFLSGLGFFIALQFVGFYFYSDYTKRQTLIEEEKIIAFREAELNKQGAEVVCPCDRGIKSFVPISINETNEYQCPGCNKPVHVLVNLKTVLATIPVTDTLEDVVVNTLKK